MSHICAVQIVQFIFRNVNVLSFFGLLKAVDSFPKLFVVRPPTVNITMCS